VNINEIRALEKNDVVIVYGGSTDIYENEARAGLRQLMKFTTETQNTNILIVTALHRHDLHESSCVNKEIKLFNNKLQKIMKIKGNVKIIQTDLSRNDFTRHGMHLNASDKEKTVEL
jgi:capsular polysaccharide biosynthesis protein